MRIGAALASLALATAAFAQEIPLHTGWVVDQAGVLTPAENRQLTELLERIDARTGVQIAVLIVSRLETPIEDFSVRVQESWQLGDTETDSGALIVVALEDRRSHIEVGYGLEPVLPDGVAGQLLREEMAPQFRAGNYLAGLERTALRVAEAAGGEFQPTRPSRGRSGLFVMLLLVGAQLLGYLGNALRPWVAGLAGSGVALVLGLLFAGPLALIVFVPLGFFAGLAATGMTRAAAERRSASWGYGPGGMMMMGRGGGFGGFGEGFGGRGGASGGGGASGSW